MEKIKDIIIENKTKILFTAILIIAIFVRIYKVQEIPHGLNVDEAGMAYDAYCLANYGTDRYLNHLPVYLINFGGGQSALYAYITSILIKIMGFSIFTIRLPAIVLGILAIIACYFMTKDKLGERFALAFMALIAICPWHIMSSRWGLDCNLLAPMSIISIFLLSKAKNTIGYITAGISFGLTLYTYALSYIILPIFLALSIIYMLYTKKIKFKNVVIMGVPIFIFAIPLMLMLLVNNGIIEQIDSFITIPKLFSYRGTEIKLSLVRNNISFLKTMFTNDTLVYNALPEYGTIYLFAIFLSIFGFFVEINNLVRNIRNKKFEINSIILFLFIAGITCMLIIDDPNISKANVVFIPLLFFVTTTIQHIYRNYKTFFYIIIILYAINFISFSNFYFKKYEIKYEYQPCFERDLTDALNYVEDKFEKNNIYIYTSSPEPYIYTLVKNRISPYEFNETLHEGHKNDFSYGRYYFGRYYYENEELQDNAIYLVRDNDNLVEKLKNNDFKIEQIKKYTIAYK